MMMKFVMFGFLINVFCLSFLLSSVQADSEFTTLGLEKYSKGNHCQCINYDCGCCTQLVVPKLMNGKLCSNFSYLPDEYGISATITYKELTIYNETVSLKNPPHICVVHIDGIKMEICFRLYNLDIKNNCLSGCAEFEIEFFHVVPFKKIELGCFGCKNDNNNNNNTQHQSNDLVKEQHPQVILV